MELRHGFRWLKSSVLEIFDRAKLRIAGHNYMAVEDSDQIVHPANFEKTPRLITRNLRSALIGSFLIAAIISGIYTSISTIIRAIERVTATERGGPFPPRQFEKSLSMVFMGTIMSGMTFYLWELDGPSLMILRATISLVDLHSMGTIINTDLAVLTNTTALGSYGLSFGH